MLIPPPSPGVYENSADQYPAWDAVRAGWLRDLADSPARCRYFQLNGRSITKEMRLGSAIHCRLLEPEIFESKYVTIKNENSRTKAAQEAKAELIEEFGEDCFLPWADYNKVISIADTIQSDREFAKLEKAFSLKELAVVWDDAETGLRCKALFDAISLTGQFIADLKTCPKSNPQDFRWKVVRDGYDVQAAHYMKGAAAAGIDIEDFIFIAVEKTPPFMVGIYPLTIKSINAAKDKHTELMKRYAVCSQHNKWPGYGMQDLDLPGQFDAKTGDNDDDGETNGGE